MDRIERARAFAALGDPVRLGVVELLSDQDLAPQALATALQVPSNLLAHHLRVLEEVGIVERHQSEGDRRRTYVHLVESRLGGLLHVGPRRAASRVLFVCTGNSARSILAEAIWARHSSVPAASAGTHPADRINPRTRTAAKRAGVHLASTTPRHIDDVLAKDDLVVSVCDGVNEELCGVIKAQLHWSIPDPAIVDTDQAFDGAVEELTERIARLAAVVTSASH